MLAHNATITCSDVSLTRRFAVQSMRLSVLSLRKGKILLLESTRRGYLARGEFII